MKREHILSLKLHHLFFPGIFLYRLMFMCNRLFLQFSANPKCNEKRSLKDIKCLIERWKSFLLRKFSTNWESNDQSKCTFNCPESNFAFCQFSLSHGSIVIFVIPNEKTKSIHFYFHVYYQLCNPQGLCIFLRFVVVEQ